ncbi:hypothetical protein [Kinneretia aquatilis]|uniref:hypothetical protein n=1 Tax=Kinneretia aquatilis TaxID=2070761 RepID=UPI0014953699|nr:hypothetical protein [Paucibacter aquatile]WIV96877.1 hypothetical protein K9V56_017865 [Paucibacter aquatile]
MTLSDLTQLVGRHSLAQGGPNTPEAKQFELTGPKATEFTGDSDAAVYLIFEKVGSSKRHLLTYMTWRMSLQREASTFGGPKPQSESADSTRCLAHDRQSYLAIRDDLSSWNRQAVIEATPQFKAKHNLHAAYMRPTFAEICPNGVSDAVNSGSVTTPRHNYSLNRTRNGMPPSGLISFWPCGALPSLAG